MRCSTPPCTLRSRPGDIRQCLSCFVDPQARHAALRRISAPPTGLEADIAEANSELDGLLGGDALSFPAATAPVGAQPDSVHADVACPQPAPTWCTAPAAASSRAAAHSTEPVAADEGRRHSVADSSAGPRLTHVDRSVLPPLRLAASPSACIPAGCRHRGHADLGLNHGSPRVGSTGRAHMVDVSGKAPSVRSATASGVVALGPEAFALVAANGLRKGDVLTVAQLAGAGAGPGRRRAAQWPCPAGARWPGRGDPAPAVPLGRAAAQQKCGYAGAVSAWTAVSGATRPAANPAQGATAAPAQPARAAHAR